MQLGTATATFYHLLVAVKPPFAPYNVLHIPHLDVNLVSLGILHHQGVSVKNLNNSLVLSKNGEELFRASLIDSTGTLYHIQYRPLTSNMAYLAKTPSSICL